MLVDALAADQRWLQQRTPSLYVVVRGNRKHLHTTYQSRCVEVGSGSGYVVTSLAILLQQDSGRHVEHIAVDITPAAVTATTTTARQHTVCSMDNCKRTPGQQQHTQVAACVDVVQDDLLRGLVPRLQGAVDILVCNPPYVPTPTEEVDRGGIAAAWAGGDRGRVVVDRLLPLVPQVLSTRGVFYLVTVPENDPHGVQHVLDAD